MSEYEKQLIEDGIQKALLIVDVQNDFCPSGALAVPDGDRVVPAALKLNC